MLLSGELQISQQLIKRCQALASSFSVNSRTTVTASEPTLAECDSLICEIDQANDWGIITDQEAIEMLKVVYRCRYNVMRGEKAASPSVHSPIHNSI